MFARSTSISGDPGAIDAGIDYIRDEVLPSVTTMDGCLGMSLVVDRDSGRCIATSSWQSREQMDATGEMVSSMRGRAAEILRGAPRVEEWEVAVMHRDHPTHDGARCRIVWARPEDMDRTLYYWRHNVLTEMEGMDGFCSASLFADRTRGITCATVVFDAQESLEASRDQAAEMRKRGEAETGVHFLDILECELAIAHLRVPELV